MSSSTSNADSSASCNKIVVFELPMSFIKSPQQFCDNVYRQLKDSDIFKTFFDLPQTSGGLEAAAASAAMIRGLAYKYFYHKTNPHHFFVARGKHVLKLELPPPAPVLKKGNFDVKLAFKIFAGHTVDAGGVKLSPAGGWLLSFGGDGFVSMREVDGLDPTVEGEDGEGGGDVGKIYSFRPHDFRRGAVVDVCVTPDLEQIYSVGADGVLTAYRCQMQAGLRVRSDRRLGLRVRLPLKF